MTQEMSLSFVGSTTWLAGSTSRKWQAARTRSDRQRRAPLTRSDHHVGRQVTVMVPAAEKMALAHVTNENKLAKSREVTMPEYESVPTNKSTEATSSTNDFTNE